MRLLCFYVVGLLLCSLSAAAQTDRPEQVPPGIHKATTLPGPAAGTPPVFIQAPPRAADPVRLKREADELAKLAQLIPDEINQVEKNQLPKDLIEHLKRIEKLSKKLRHDLSP